MKGNNTLLLNQATIMQAVQEYLDARCIGGGPIVTCVTFRGSTSDFAVEVEGKKETK